MAEKTVAHARLSFVNEIFQRDPMGAIRSRLGQGTDVIDYRVQSIILPGCKIVVDVDYNKIETSTFRTLYVKSKDLRKIETQPGTIEGQYMVSVNGINVNLVIEDEIRDEMPIKLYSHNIPGVCQYMGMVLDSPLHGYSTLTPVSAWPIIETNEKGGKEWFTESETVANYKLEASAFDELRSVNNVKLVKSFTECDDNRTTGYVISYTQLPDEAINGHIIIVPRRKSDLLFYYPTASNIIYEDEMTFIKGFMRFDQTNLK